MLDFCFDDFARAYTPDGLAHMSDADFDLLCTAQNAKVAKLAATPCRSRYDARERLRLACYLTKIAPSPIGAMLAPWMQAVLDDMYGPGLRLTSLKAMRKALADLPETYTRRHEHMEESVESLCRAALAALTRPVAVPAHAVVLKEWSRGSASRLS